ncbi:hypothetical protein LZ554_006567 [Drepanopeziza brunnea f. sp. 'monogermtubi']|nr:hypothetical protein LZ554_006567 [Drepanopeziza brunnea f. sp. 'monogermtubi']
MAGPSIQFYIHAQKAAIERFPPILYPHLPLSNPLYNRILAPHNTPRRHCLFAATFPPSTPPELIPETYTILFADRSRHLESQIWLFNPLVTLHPPTPLPPAAHRSLLAQHIEATILFLRDVQIPEAPGWPFSPVLKFACLHETIGTILLEELVGTAREEAVPRATTWNMWLVQTATISAARGAREGALLLLPDGYTMARVPEDQLDIVISTSSIPRQASTLKLQPSIGLRDGEGRMVAWGFVGIDGSLATLYVLPAYRGKGLARCVAEELVGRLGRGEFADLGFDGRSGWVHSDVCDGNEGSEGVMRALGGTVGCRSQYIWVDSTKL